MTSVADNEALRENGRPVHLLRAEADYRVSTRGGAEGDLPTLELQVEDCSFEGRGVAGDVSFDTRSPESLRALAGVKGGPALLQAMESARSDPQRVRLDADGAPQVPDAVAAGATVGLRIGWVPGTLPFGDLQGRAVPGAEWRCDGVLRAADAGLRYNDPLVVSGTWRVADWDAESGVARLALEGGEEFDDRRLRTTRVESCELRGEATWSADRRLVTRSRVTVTVVLREREGRPVRIDWTVTLAEDLVE